MVSALPRRRAGRSFCSVIELGRIDSSESPEDSSASPDHGRGTPVALSGYMTMLRLTKAQRTLLVEKLPDLAKLFAGGCVVGQSLGSGPFSGWLCVIGFTLWLALMGVALVIAEGVS